MSDLFVTNRLPAGAKRPGRILPAGEKVPAGTWVYCVAMGQWALSSVSSVLNCSGEHYLEAGSESDSSSLDEPALEAFFSGMSEEALEWAAAYLAGRGIGASTDLSEQTPVEPRYPTVDDDPIEQLLQTGKTIVWSDEEGPETEEIATVGRTRGATANINIRQAETLLISERRRLADDESEAYRESRWRLARAWSAYLELALEASTEEGESVMSLVLEQNPKLADQLRVAFGVRR